MIGEGAAHRSSSRNHARGNHHGDAGREQRDDERLLFRRQQRDQIGGRERQRDQARPQRAARVFRLAPSAQTRSLIFSRIRPVGRQAMMAMTTAKANTSL